MNKSSVNISLTTQNLSVVSQCRICLQNVLIANSYCSCSGHTKGVHTKCLLEWAQRNKIFTDQRNNKYFYCELCKDKIILIVAQNLYCGSKEQVEEYLKKHPFQMAMTVIFFLVFLGLWISSIYQSVERDGSTKTIFMISAIACGIIVVVTVIGFIWKVVVKQKQTYIGVKSKYKS